MLTLGCRYEKKEARLGLDMQSCMEDTELEEGEASSYHDEDTEVDPDTDFSYLDIKVTDVLGHLRKDFEGEVSAENLGAKFGGYGSFLPSHERSPPVLSCSGSPQRPQLSTLPSSSRTIPTEIVHQNPVSGSAGIVPSGRSKSSNNTHSLLKPHSEKVSKRSGVSHVAAAASEKCSAQDQNKSSQSLKLRIKVGPDNGWAKKSAEICSGLGIHATPSSSSLGTSREPSPDLQDKSVESPTTILRIMTSFPVPRGTLLSPLPENLLNLQEKKKSLVKDYKPETLHKCDNELSSVQESGLCARRDVKESDGRKLKNKKSNEIISHLNVSGAQYLPAKETSRLPTPLGSRVSDKIPETLVDGVRSERREDRRCPAEEKLPLPEVPKMGRIGPPFGQNLAKNAIRHAQKTSEDRKKCPQELMDFNQKKGSNACSSLAVTSEGSEGKINGPVAHKKKKLTSKSITQEQHMAKMPRGNDPLTKDGKEVSVNQSNGPVLHVAKEGMAAPTCVSKENKKVSSHSAGSPGRKNDQTRQQKIFSKGTSKISSKTTVDDLKAVEADTRKGLTGSLGIRQKDKKEEGDSVNLMPSENPKEKYGLKKIEKSPAPDKHPKVSSATAISNEPSTEAGIPPTSAPVMVKENWVCCDRCQKWRLIPYEMDPNTLPDKWICSMLYWLPEFNKCSFSEDETTAALNRLYQIPAPANQNNVPSQQNGSSSGLTLQETIFQDQLHSLTSDTMSFAAKKKLGGSKDSSVPPNKVGNVQLQLATKRNQQIPSKNRLVSDGKQSSLTFGQVKPSLHLDNKQNNYPIDASMHSQKDKKKCSELHGKGEHLEPNGEQLKAKCKRMTDDENSRAFKKAKVEESGSLDDWQYGHERSGKAFCNTSNEMTVKLPGGRSLQHEHMSSRGINDIKDDILISEKPLRGQVEDCLPLKSRIGNDFSNSSKSNDSGNVAKKRKTKGWQESHIQQGAIPDLAANTSAVGDDMDDNGNRKKKHKMSKVGAHENGAIKVAEKFNEPATIGKNILSIGRNSIAGNEETDKRQDHAGLLKSDCIAATSSSSKVSGSQKSKAKFKEPKGSPVESVSSSPLRMLSPHKISANGRQSFLDNEDERRMNFMDGGNQGYRKAGKGISSFLEGNSSQGRKQVAELSVHESRQTSHSGQDAGISNKNFGAKSKNLKQAKNLGSSRLSSLSNHERGLNNRESEGPKDAHGFSGELKKNFQADGSAVQPFCKGSSSGIQDKHVKDRNQKKSFDSFTGRHEMGKGDGSHRHECNAYFHGKKYHQPKSGMMEQKDVQNLPISGKQQTGSKAAYLKQQNLSAVSGEGNRSGHVLLEKKEQDEIKMVSVKSTQVMNKNVMPGPLLPQIPILIKDSRNRSASESCAAGMQNIPEQHGKPHIQSEAHSAPSKYVSNIALVKDQSANSPVPKDSSQLAASSAIKEATDLKHTADRVKNGGQEQVSIGLYFEAALKFLHAAFLLEPVHAESARHGELTQSMKMYRETAALCEFCAHEFERHKDLAAACLAYKCMEVAYMRVIYAKNLCASKDHNELQNALQMVPAGVSPSSSASDVDNLNNQAVEREGLVKSLISPQSGNDNIVITCHRANFVRILDFANDMNAAMEALRKSANSFSVANSKSGVSRYEQDGLSSVKRALDFNVHDVDGVLHLIRVAMQSIS